MPSRTRLTLILATVDEHLQVAGAETFNKFQKSVILFPPLPITDILTRKINNLDNEVSPSPVILTHTHPAYPAA